MEMKEIRKAELFDLLVLKRENEESGIKVRGLKNLILKTEAVMDAEDVAWVEKKIAELE
jgi:hypothetical protein